MGSRATLQGQCDAVQQEVFGQMAAAYGQRLPLQVCRSAAGFYLGTLSPDGLPYSRESAEYWRRPEQAQRALDTRSFTQRFEP